MAMNALDDQRAARVVDRNSGRPGTASDTDYHLSARQWSSYTREIVIGFRKIVQVLLLITFSCSFHSAAETLEQET